jgi:hypothetical protein
MKAAKRNHTTGTTITTTIVKAQQFAQMMKSLFFGLLIVTMALADVYVIVIFVLARQKFQ